jgi:hypothetical protein
MYSIPQQGWNDRPDAAWAQKLRSQEVGLERLR